MFVIESIIKNMARDLYKNKYLITSARAKWHDYNNGRYFVTICTNKRQHYFGEIINNKMFLSQIGHFAESYISIIESKYDDIKIASHVIMPNHIHLIIIINSSYRNYNTKKESNDNKEVNEMMSHIAKCRGRLSLFISKYKSSITKNAIKNDIPFSWQTRFHDIIIRDDKEFYNIKKYIENNISDWKDDEYYSNHIIQ